MEEPYDDETRSFTQEPPPREREPEYIYYNNTPQQQIVSQPIDIFGNLDRTAYILIFVTFILGFFMGKTMQPVIIRQ